MVNVFGRECSRPAETARPAARTTSTHWQSLPALDIDGVAAPVGLSKFVIADSEFLRVQLLQFRSLRVQTSGNE